MRPLFKLLISITTKSDNKRSKEQWKTQLIPFRNSSLNLRAVRRCPNQEQSIVILLVKFFQTIMVGWMNRVYSCCLWTVAQHIIEKLLFSHPTWKKHFSSVKVIKSLFQQSRFSKVFKSFSHTDNFSLLLSCLHGGIQNIQWRLTKDTDHLHWSDTVSLALIFKHLKIHQVLKRKNVEPRNKQKKQVAHVNMLHSEAIRH